MNETPTNPAQPTATGSLTPKKSLRVGPLLVVAFVLIVIAGGVYAWFYFNNQVKPLEDQAQALRGFIENRTKYATLDPAYKDENKDLIADTPTEATKLLDPQELLFTEVAGDDPEELATKWEPFRKHLESVLGPGRKVKYLTAIGGSAASPPIQPKPDERPEQDPNLQNPTEIREVQQQLELMKAGKLHIAAFTTGQVPMAVNGAGFVPLFCPATEENVYSYKMQIIVPAESPVKDVAELKDKTIAFVSLSSNSGGKAPIVRLQEKYNLNPMNKDYRFTITGRHDNSILGVCVGRDAAPVLANRKATKEAKAAVMEKPGAKYDAACVPSDFLARLVADGTVKAEQFRVIYEEGPYPVVCFGVPHNLKPELVAKIKEAFKTFSFAGNSVGEKYKGANQVKFVEVNYLKDWQTVRDIDEKLPNVLKAK